MPVAGAMGAGNLMKLTKSWGQARMEKIAAADETHLLLREAS